MVKQSKFEAETIKAAGKILEQRATGLLGVSLDDIQAVGKLLSRNAEILTPLLNKYRNLLD